MLPASVPQRIAAHPGTLAVVLCLLVAAVTFRATLRTGLLDTHGALHDVWVEEDARRAGVAKRLVGELCARLESLGAPRIVLSSATDLASPKSMSFTVKVRSRSASSTSKMLSGLMSR